MYYFDFVIVLYSAPMNLCASTKVSIFSKTNFNVRGHHLFEEQLCVFFFDLLALKGTARERKKIVYNLPERRTFQTKRIYHAVLNTVCF